MAFILFFGCSKLINPLSLWYMHPAQVQSTIFSVESCKKPIKVINLEINNSCLFGSRKSSISPAGNGANDFAQLALTRSTLSEIITEPSAAMPQNRFTDLSAPCQQDYHIWWWISHLKHHFPITNQRCLMVDFTYIGSKHNSSLVVIDHKPEIAFEILKNLVGRDRPSVP